MLLIFAIGFSGYSAAAHAFMPGDCDPVSMAKMAESDMDMSDCPGHKGHEDAKKDVGPDKKSKEKCLDCTHCCMSHATFHQNSMIAFPQIASIVIPSIDSGEARDNLFSLLRPPRSLV